jgi:hypothetical protein
MMADMVNKKKKTEEEDRRARPNPVRHGVCIAN